jgi:hypothetical protein
LAQVMGWIVEMVPFQGFTHFHRGTEERWQSVTAGTQHARRRQLNQKLNNFVFVGGIEVILHFYQLGFVFIKTSNCAQAVAILPSSIFPERSIV